MEKIKNLPGDVPKNEPDVAQTLVPSACQKIIPANGGQKGLNNLTALLETIIENIPDMIFVKDAKDLRFVLFNKAGESILGYSRQDLIGKNDYDFFPKEEADFFTQNDRKVLDSKSILDIPEEPIQTKHGMRTLHTKKVTICDESGQVLYLLGISEDVTDRKNAERALQNLNAALERRSTRLESMNKELREFAYVASHDLREPIRKMANFAELLTLEKKPQLDAEAQSYLDHIVDGAHRMHRLVDDLLTFARLGTDPVPAETVNAEEVLEQTKNDLGEIIRETRAVVTHDPLPAITFNRVQLGQLFQNIIGNALKFQEKGVAPRIHVSAKKSAEGWTFSFKDNGIGIEQKYLTDIFSLFRRLHSKDAFPGSGLGLAICKKIVERQYGKIWVESVPHDGSIFHFTVPVMPHGED